MPSTLPSAVLLASALATGVGAPAPQTPIERLDALMADYAGDVPGASVLVVRDGEIVVRRAWGLADVDKGVPASPATNYRLASVSKQFTAAAILLLAEDGRLRLDIFLPLGMDATLARVDEGPPVAHRAYGHGEDGAWRRTDQSPTSAVLGDGGIYSSIDDLAKWDAALYDDRLLSAESRRLAFAPHVATDDPAVRYGYGWRITGDTLWHSGETIGFRNVIVRWPAQKLTVVVLTNRDDPEPYPLALRIAALFP